jgi:hypothetical protein
MNRNSYFVEKEENNIQKLNTENFIPKEDIQDEELKDNPYNESESSREDYLPVNEDLFKERNSVIKGMSLAFVFFSVIIYSLLYMLAPEKEANLIFEGNNNLTLFDKSICLNGSKFKNFYKLDTMNIKEKMIIMNISLNCHLNNNNDYLVVKMIYSKEDKIINNIFIENSIISKEIELDSIKETYNDYKIHDFPFWICIFNKDNNNKKNISSDYLINFL